MGGGSLQADIVQVVHSNKSLSKKEDNKHDKPKDIFKQLTHSRSSMFVKQVQI